MVYVCVCVCGVWGARQGSGNSPLLRIGRSTEKAPESKTSLLGALSLGRWDGLLRSVCASWSAVLRVRVLVRQWRRQPRAQTPSCWPPRDRKTTQPRATEDRR
jgi:hypothetical protein